MIVMLEKKEEIKLFIAQYISCFTSLLVEVSLVKNKLVQNTTHRAFEGNFDT